MPNQTPFINASALFTGLAQAAAIGTFVLVMSMYRDQSIMKEQLSEQKTINKDVDELKQRVAKIEAILPDRIRIKEEEKR